jgi:hypothetical protein
MDEAFKSGKVFCLPVAIAAAHKLVRFERDVNSMDKTLIVLGCYAGRESHHSNLSWRSPFAFNHKGIFHVHIHLRRAEGNGGKNTQLVSFSGRHPRGSFLRNLKDANLSEEDFFGGKKRKGIKLDITPQLRQFPLIPCGRVVWLGEWPDSPRYIASSIRGCWLWLRRWNSLVRTPQENPRYSPSISALRALR